MGSQPHTTHMQHCHTQIPNLWAFLVLKEYVQIDNVEEQRKIKEDSIQNTEEVEKILAIREEMDAKQELKSKYAKRSVETTSGVERLQLRVAIEKLEEEVYELREMLLQSKLDAELLLEKEIEDFKDVRAIVIES